MAWRPMAWRHAVQIVTPDASCWQAEFSAADQMKNDGVTFKASH